jgi:hypothetical protein
MTDSDFNMFAREVISDKQYTDESILDYIKEDSEHYSNPRNIPRYPIDPYEWIHRVVLP